MVLGALGKGATEQGLPGEVFDSRILKTELQLAR